MARAQYRARVREVRRDIPDTISIDFAPCGMDPITSVDDHVKIVLPPDGDLRRPVDETVEHPLLRTYTRRRWSDDGSWGLDVLVFGPAYGPDAHDGPGSQWAATVRPGDEVTVRGPGGHWDMSGPLDHVLAVGDDVARPAIANALAALPSTATATVVLQDGHDDYPLPVRDGVEVVRVPRSPDGRDLVAAVTALDLPDGTFAYVHGQAAMVRPLRRHLRLERGIPRNHLQLSAYWFAGRDADGWRAMKKDFNQSMEAESGD